MAWTDKQLRAHKKASAGLSVATSTMGITALGLAGARAGAPRALKMAHQAGRLKNVKPKQLKAFKAKSTGLQNGLITTSAGVGGVGGLNYAAIQNAEAKRRPRAPRPVAKSFTEVSMDGMDFGLGQVRQGDIEEITKFALPKISMGGLKKVGAATGAKIQTGAATAVPKVKAAGGVAGAKWGGLSAPKKAAVAGTGGVLAGTAGGLAMRKVNKAYDPEKKRLRRLDAYNAGTNAAAGGLAVGAGVAGHSLKRQAAGALKVTSHKTGGKTVSVSAAKLKPLGKKGAVTAALGLGAVGAAVGADRIRSYGRGNGRSYKPLHGQY